METAAPTGIEAHVVTDNRRCVTCSYDLRGLLSSGSCPECGTPIAKSLRDNLLINSSPEYLAKIHRGVFFVQAAIIGMILVVFLGILGMIVVGVLAGMGGGRGGGVSWFGVYGVQVVSSLLSLVYAGVALYGWWLFSEADPRASATDRGETPRRIVRIAVIVEAALTVAMQAVSMISLAGIGVAAGGGTAGTGAAGVGVGVSAMVIVSALLTLAYYVALAVRYFASMLYVRWLSARIPNEKAMARAKYMMWLGPLLCTVGVAILVGPLIALVVYYNLLDWVRKDIKKTRATLGMRPVDALQSVPA